MLQKSLFLTVFMVLSLTVRSQNDQLTINDHVWRPFTQAIMTQDVGSFIQVHSKDVMRVERDSRRVLNYEQYKSSMEKSWPSWKQSIAAEKTSYTFELRFLERVSNGDQAFEVGYFKNESINAKGEKRASYGQFHVALRKENNVWKILVDSDSNNNRTITEEMFLAAKPME